MHRSSWVLSAALVLLSFLRPAAADVFLLRSGGRIEGDLVNADENPRTSYVVSLPNGGRVTLDAATVEKVQPVKPELAEYEKLRRKYPDTVEGQLQLAAWCREHGLETQRKTHLERVIQIDPDQAEARRLLGYRLVKGQWMTHDEEMADKGYVKFNGRWMPSRRRNSKKVATTNSRPKRTGSGRFPPGGRGSRANRPSKARRTSAQSTTPWPFSDWRRS